MKQLKGEGKTIRRRLSSFTAAFEKIFRSERKHRHRRPSNNKQTNKQRGSFRVEAVPFRTDNLESGTLSTAHSLFVSGRVNEEERMQPTSQQQGNAPPQNCYFRDRRSGAWVLCRHYLRDCKAPDPLLNLELPESFRRELNQLAKPIDFRLGDSFVRRQILVPQSKGTCLIRSDQLLLSKHGGGIIYERLLEACPVQLTERQKDILKFTCEQGGRFACYHLYLWTRGIRYTAEMKASVMARIARSASE